MSNEDQYSRDIKDYTQQKRFPKVEYDPTPYYNRKTATEKKLNFFYGDHL